MVERGDCNFGKGETLWKGPKKCRRGCICEKTDKGKLCRRGEEARGMDRLECNMDMESRTLEYYKTRGAAKRAIFKRDHLGELSSRRRMLRERNFVRIW